MCHFVCNTSYSWNTTLALFASVQDEMMAFRTVTARKQLKRKRRQSANRVLYNFSQSISRILKTSDSKEKPIKTEHCEQAIKNFNEHYEQTENGEDAEVKIKNTR